MKRILLLPPRITGRLLYKQGRLFRLILMTLVFITALYTKEYRGEHQLIINNHIGGILYVLFGSLLFSVLFPRLQYYWLVSAAFLLTCILEFIQYFRFPFMVELTQDKTMAYIFGLSFNPVDFIYYAAGAVISCLLLLGLSAESTTASSVIAGNANEEAWLTAGSQSASTGTLSQQGNLPQNSPVPKQPNPQPVEAS